MIQIVFAAVATLLLSACAKQPELSPQPATATEATRVALHFTAAAGLNPGATGQPSPVRVRIYELKNTAGFLRADYFALAERAQSVLGADLIDQDETLVQPGEQLSVNRDLNTFTRHVGLVMAYREIDQAQWRTVLTVAPRQPLEFQISLDAHAVRSDIVPSRAQ